MCTGGWLTLCSGNQHSTAKQASSKEKSKNESPTERTHTHLHAHRHQTGHQDKVHVAYCCLPEHRRMTTASRSPAVLHAQRAVPIRVRRCTGAGAGGGWMVSRSERGPRHCPRPGPATAGSTGKKSSCASCPRSPRDLYNPQLCSACIPIASPTSPPAPPLLSCPGSPGFLAVSLEYHLNSQPKTHLLAPLSVWRIPRGCSPTSTESELTCHF